MGIESFVYDYLNKPEITIVPEIAYGLGSHKAIDWISISHESDKREVFINCKGLLLVGGCELQQLSSFFGPARVEFVNKVNTRKGDDYIVRYDDPSFFITDRKTLLENEALKTLSSWTHEDAILLDENLGRAEIIILGMRAALRHHYVVTRNGIMFRMERRNIKLYQQKHTEWFRDNFSIFNPGVRDRLDLMERAFELVARQSRQDAHVFIIGANTRNVPEFTELAASLAYNKFCRGACLKHTDRFHFVDVDTIVSEDLLVDSDHFTRIGYYQLYSYIVRTVSAELET